MVVDQVRGVWSDRPVKQTIVVSAPTFADNLQGVAVSPGGRDDHFDNDDDDDNDDNDSNDDDDDVNNEAIRMIDIIMVKMTSVCWP